MKRSIIFLTTCLLALALVPATTGCGGGDDECLVDGENCTSAYVEENYGDGRGCCDGMSCSEGPSSGVLICQ
ncbi:MAG: hypothetical protein RIF41_23920 [Polyangiaceae bacterium]